MYFDESDVVRHHLVQRIIRAYDEHKTRVAEEQMLLLDAKGHTNGKTNGAGETTPPQEKTAVAPSEENPVRE